VPTICHAPLGDGHAERAGVAQEVVSRHYFLHIPREKTHAATRCIYDAFDRRQVMAAVLGEACWVPMFMALGAFGQSCLSRAPRRGKTFSLPQRHGMLAGVVPMEFLVRLSRGLRGLLTTEWQGERMVSVTSRGGGISFHLTTAGGNGRWEGHVTLEDQFRPHHGVHDCVNAPDTIGGAIDTDALRTEWVSGRRVLGQVPSAPLRADIAADSVVGHTAFRLRVTDLHRLYRELRQSLEELGGSHASLGEAFYEVVSDAGSVSIGQEGRIECHGAAAYVQYCHNVVEHVSRTRARRASLPFNRLCHRVGVTMTILAASLGAVVVSDGALGSGPHHGPMCYIAGAVADLRRKNRLCTVSVGSDEVKWNHGVRTAAMLRIGYGICHGVIDQEGISKGEKPQGPQPGGSLVLECTENPVEAGQCPIQMRGLGPSTRWMWRYILAAVIGCPVVVKPGSVEPNNEPAVIDKIIVCEAASAGCTMGNQPETSWQFDAVRALRLGYLRRGASPRARRSNAVVSSSSRDDNVIINVKDVCCDMCVEAQLCGQPRVIEECIAEITRDATEPELPLTVPGSWRNRGFMGSFGGRMAL
jgi:hypothetical protein